jgi:hypothetical protein
VVSARSPALAAFASLDIARHSHATPTATLKSFKLRLSQLQQRGAALIPGSDAQHQVEKAGMRIAEQGERFSL